MERNLLKGDMLVKVLVATSIVLALALFFVLVIQPGITGRLIQAQEEGLEWAVVSIMYQASQCQPVPLQYGNDTITVIAMHCLQTPEEQGMDQFDQFEQFEQSEQLE